MWGGESAWSRKKQFKEGSTTCKGERKESQKPDQVDKVAWELQAGIQILIFVWGGLAGREDGGSVTPKFMGGLPSTRLLFPGFTKQLHWWRSIMLRKTHYTARIRDEAQLWLC